jgi:4-amino-4-deoxy-L-arabinose transferase-like glycosyltransferase
VATAMFRYNNPDALLVLLLVAAAYCMVRAIENGGTRWVALTGAVVGFAFLTKMLQAFLPLPGLALAFLVAAPIPLWKRIGALAVGVVTMIVSAGWYIALVALWPAGSRPYIAGSTDNSLLQLAFGYNGIDRIVGQDHPGGGHGPGGFGGANLFFGGQAGIGRMFGQSMGTEASWLLPAALIGLAALLWLTRRAVRTDQLRAAALLWGGWLLVTGAVFSFMDGTIHPYYTVALAPAIAALVGMSVAALWPLRARSRSCWRPRASGRSSCSAARRTGCPRCAGSSRSALSWSLWCWPSARSGRAGPPRWRHWRPWCSGSARRWPTRSRRW